MRNEKNLDQWLSSEFGGTERQKLEESSSRHNAMVLQWAKTTKKNCLGLYLCI